jgi:hypothetical protein
MRMAFVLPAFLVCALSPARLSAQEALTAAKIPGFLERYDRNFSFVEEAYTDFAKEDLPLRDTQAKPLARRPIEDRRLVISSLRQLSREVAANPQSLVLVTKIVLQTQQLTDDLFDLSQIAYDNDLEDLGKRLAVAQTTMQQNGDSLASYLLSLAAEKEDRLRKLEKENAELQLRIKPAKP